MPDRELYIKHIELHIPIHKKDKTGGLLPQALLDAITHSITPACPVPICQP